MKRIAFLVVAALSLGAQPPQTLVTGVSATASNTVSSAITLVGSNAKMVMSISAKDGSVTFGEGITPDVAARRFAEEMKRAWPTVCGDGK